MASGIYVIIDVWLVEWARDPGTNVVTPARLAAPVKGNKFEPLVCS